MSRLFLLTFLTIISLPCVSLACDACGICQETKEERAEILKQEFLFSDKDRDNRLSAEEYVNYKYRLSQHKVNEKRTGIYKSGFNSYDENHDGFITEDQFKSLAAPKCGD